MLVTGKVGGADGVWGALTCWWGLPVWLVLPAWWVLPGQWGLPKHIGGCARWVLSGNWNRCRPPGPCSQRSPPLISTAVLFHIQVINLHHQREGRSRVNSCFCVLTLSVPGRPPKPSPAVTVWPTSQWSPWFLGMSFTVFQAGVSSLNQARNNPGVWPEASLLPMFTMGSACTTLDKSLKSLHFSDLVSSVKLRLWPLAHNTLKI